MKNDNFKCFFPQVFLGQSEVVRSDVQLESVRIETADISNKFKFFETYRPDMGERKQFRITPPRDGVVQSLSPDENTASNVYIDPDIVRSGTGRDDEGAVVAALQNSQTTTKMLNMFRQMEEDAVHEPFHRELKPLKRFTPPPSSDRHGLRNERSTSNTTGDSDDYTDDSEDDSSDDSDENELNEQQQHHDIKNVDEFLLQAQSAARSKQLRAKFERWESKEIIREKNNGSSVMLYDGEDQSQVETAKE